MVKIMYLHWTSGSALDLLRQIALELGLEPAHYRGDLVRQISEAIVHLNMAEAKTATSNRLLSALRPRSLAGEAALLCWIAWFVLRCIAAPLFRFVADHDIYSAILRVYYGVPFMLLDSVIAPAIIYGLFLTGGIVLGRSAGRKPEYRQCPMCAEAVIFEAMKCRFCGADLPLSSGIAESVPAHDLMRRGGIVHGFVRIFPRRTAALTGKEMGTRGAAGQVGEALDTERLAAAWLLGGVVPIALEYRFHPYSWLLSGEYTLIVVAFFDVVLECPTTYRRYCSDTAKQSTITTMAPHSPVPPSIRDRLTASERLTQTAADQCIQTPSKPKCLVHSRQPTRSKSPLTFRRETVSSPPAEAQHCP